MCAILCLLVMLCCMRFQYYNPKDMADFITVPLRNNMTMNSVISWYMRLRESQTPAEMRELILPDCDSCKAFSFAKGGLCSRGSCRNGATKCLCWQHRFLILNRQAPNKRCATAQHNCM